MRGSQSNCNINFAVHSPVAKLPASIGPLREGAVTEGDWGRMRGSQSICDINFAVHSPVAKLPAPYAWKASFPIYGRGNRTRPCCCRGESLRCHFDKKAIGRMPHGFLVEVAGLELAASSTRNWRATTCATPRYRAIISHFSCFVKWKMAFFKSLCAAKRGRRSPLPAKNTRRRAG